MPTDLQPQQPDRDRADQTLIRRATAWLAWLGWLRDNPGQATGIGIPSATDARALAVVLDILAVEVPHLDADLRHQTVQSCRNMLGDTTADLRTH